MFPSGILATNQTTNEHFSFPTLASHAYLTFRSLTPAKIPCPWLLYRAALEPLPSSSNPGLHFLPLLPWPMLSFPLLPFLPWAPPAPFTLSFDISAHLSSWKVRILEGTCVNDSASRPHPQIQVESSTRPYGSRRENKRPEKHIQQ